MKRLSLLIVSLGLGIARCDAASAQHSHSAHPNQSAASTAVPPVSLGGFAPGGGTLVYGISKIGEEYAKSPEHIEAGKQLFQAMNCTGCHSNGGGGMGPGLMGKTRIYGGSVENIASTIVEGRPNGMPSFRSLLPMEQVWELAAYVKSLSDHPTEK
jgi:cytochrome c oxidase cbb3-type subunit III